MRQDSTESVETDVKETIINLTIQTQQKMEIKQPINLTTYRGYPFYQAVNHYKQLVWKIKAETARQLRLLVAPKAEATSIEIESSSDFAERQQIEKNAFEAISRIDKDRVELEFISYDNPTIGDRFNVIQMQFFTYTILEVLEARPARGKHNERDGKIAYWFRCRVSEQETIRKEEEETAEVKS